jgi:hypothetical protein
MENERNIFFFLSLLIDTIFLFYESSSLTDKDHLKSLLILLLFSAHGLHLFNTLIFVYYKL